jgi:hypothetical protein
MTTIVWVGKSAGYPLTCFHLSRRCAGKAARAAEAEIARQCGLRQCKVCGGPGSRKRRKSPPVWVGRTNYVPRRYHTDRACAGKRARRLSLRLARRIGFVPCGVCQKRDEGWAILGLQHTGEPTMVDTGTR